MPSLGSVGLKSLELITTGNGKSSVPINGKSQNNFGCPFANDIKFTELLLRSNPADMARPSSVKFKIYMFFFVILDSYRIS